MFNIDNILIFSMTFFGSLGIVYFIFFLIMDILAITIFRKVKVGLIDCQIYEINSFLSDSFNTYSVYIKQTSCESHLYIAFTIPAIRLALR